MIRSFYLVYGSIRTSPDGSIITKSVSENSSVETPAEIADGSNYRERYGRWNESWLKAAAIENVVFTIVRTYEIEYKIVDGSVTKETIVVEDFTLTYESLDN